MERISHKSHSFQEAELWDILQQIQMTPQERLDAAFKLRLRVYGSVSMDVRESGECRKIKISK